MTINKKRKQVPSDDFHCHFLAVVFESALELLIRNAKILHHAVIVFVKNTILLSQRFYQTYIHYQET
jgi:hypothetical protein